jgi:DNA-binding NarL/FixJ family response regulator
VSTIVAFSGDLMDQSKLTTALPGVELARDTARAAGATCVVVDVGRFGDVIGAIRSAAPAARIVAYGRHDDPDALDAAITAGADAAMPRSRFFRDPAAAVAP